ARPVKSPAKTRRLRGASRSPTGTFSHFHGMPLGTSAPVQHEPMGGDLGGGTLGAYAPTGSGAAAEPKGRVEDRNGHARPTGGGLLGGKLGRSRVVVDGCGGVDHLNHL